MASFIEELTWRGMVHDIMPETDATLAKGMTSGYIGFDPTADSLHIGSLVQIMILMHFQRYGHKPYALCYYNTQLYILHKVYFTKKESPIGHLWL